MSRTSRIRPRTLPFAFAILLAAPLAAGCGSDDLADRAVDQVAESSGSPDVEIDRSDGRVEVSAEDGSFVAEAGGDLPDGWPDDVPLPDDYTIETTSTLDGGTGPVHSVILRTAGEPMDVFSQLEPGFADWTEESRVVSGAGFDAVVMVQYSQGNRTASVTATEGTGDTVVSYSVGTSE
jgi:hypothetical protein